MVPNTQYDHTQYLHYFRCNKTVFEADSYTNETHLAHLNAITLFSLGIVVS